MRTRRWIFLSVAASLALATPHAAGTSSPYRGLTFEERVAAQEAIERIYYAHQIGATEPFETAVPRASLEQKVRTYLQQSLALERIFKAPITAEALHRETERIASRTRYPDRLRELYAALHDDPFLIQETLARQTLAGRLARNFFAMDETIHADARAAAESLRVRLVAATTGLEAPAPERVDLEVGDAAPDRAASHGPVFLERAAFEALRSQLPSGAGEIGVEETRDAFVVRRTIRSSPDALSFDRFVVRKTSWEEWVASLEPALDVGDVAPVAATSARPVPISSPGTVFCGPGDAWLTAGITSSNAPAPRFHHTAVWTGSEMIVWGGYGPDGISFKADGGRYDPLTDSWAPVSMVNAPTISPNASNSPYIRHRAFWTGSEMIVAMGTSFGTSGRYNPLTDTWRPVSPVGAPAGDYSAVWIGTGMLTNGGLYNPFNDVWTPLAPVPLGSAVWTGHDVLGVSGAVNGPTLSLTRYDPATDARIALPSPPIPGRDNFTTVWTGSRLIVWGGNHFVTQGGVTTEVAVNSGAVYNPATNTWTTTSTNGAPSARYLHTAVWTGSRMIVWGGNADPGTLNTGAAYDPATDTWSALSTVNAASPRDTHTAVWTGSQMVVWGGVVNPACCPGPGDLTSTGARYDPAAGAWTPISGMGAGFLPDVRTNHSAVWTGNRMIIWGGTDPEAFGAMNDGGIFDPILQQWSPTSTVNAPSARFDHVAVWTGTRMVVWGGQSNSASLGDGARWDPVADSWAPVSATNAPSPRTQASAVWTGTRMIVWSGRFASAALSSGGLYDPATNSWTAMATSGPPAIFNVAAWTGTRMAVWGGSAGLGGPLVNNGSLYDPSNNTWTVMSTLNAPPAVSQPKGVWSGNELLIWPGATGLGGLAAARYDPVSNSWTYGTSTGAPGSQSGGQPYAGVWSGTEMILWGASPGYRYNRSLDQWTAMTDIGQPTPRNFHTALWTGSTMLIWGGEAVGSSTLLNDSGQYAPAAIDVDADGDGYTVCGGDCDDTNPAIHPGATEVCNGIDDDCNGVRDDGFPDADGDGWAACGGDCDDHNPAVHPGVAEQCNGIDDNCNGLIDEGFDFDGDGFTICGGDCNETDPTQHPGAAEACNGVDDNCNGVVDEGFPDADGDGYAACVDCNDANAAVHPFAPEVCDGLDNDCNGIIDENTFASCQDTNSCTIDACGGVLGCTHHPAPDGSSCTSPVFPSFCFPAAACSSGVCQLGSPLDADGDGHADPNCGGDDCNDRDAQAWHAPAEVTNLTLSSQSPVALTWNAMATSSGPETNYDVVAGFMETSGEGFDVSGCLGNSGTNNGYADPLPTPPPDQLYWYLVRARNSCAVGTYGTASDGTPRSIMNDCP
jgi:hypothetical protein